MVHFRQLLFSILCSSVFSAPVSGFSQFYRTMETPSDLRIVSNNRFRNDFSSLSLHFRNSAINLLQQDKDAEITPMAEELTNTPATNVSPRKISNRKNGEKRRRQRFRNRLYNLYHRNLVLN